MTLTDADLSAKMYYNTQVYFREHYIDDLPNDDRAWAEKYKEWLAEQGCVIIHTNDRVLRNSLGIAPWYDKFSFENPEDATMFVLRWS
jgi:hypothetical protein